MHARDVLLLLLIAVVVGAGFEGIQSLLGDDDYEAGNALRLSIIALASIGVVRLVARRR